MKRKVLAGLLSFAMVFSLMPSTAVFAEEDVANTSQIETQAGGQEETPVENETQQEETKESDSVSALQDRIASLPSVEEFKSAEKDRQDEIYNETQAIFDEYDKLSEEEQGQVDTSKLEALFEYFNSMTEETAITPSVNGYTISSAGTYDIKGASSSTKTSSTQIYITATGNVTLNLKGNVTFNSTGSIISTTRACNLTINGNGYTIKNTNRTGKANVFYDTGGATVTFNGGTYEAPTDGGGPVVSNAAGGTISIYNATFRVTGTSDAGQAFSNGNSTLNIYSGTIDNGTLARYSCISGGTVNMYGGTVTAQAKNSAAISAAKVKFTGGTIQNSKYGISMGSNSSSVTIGGNAKFTNNTSDIYLASGKQFTIANDFAGTASVGVADTISANTKRQITTAGTSQDMLAKVTSANSAYTVNCDTSGKYLYLWKHAHTWSYSASENTITAKCTSDKDCGYYSTGLTATLNVKESVPYSGKAYDGASVTNNITSVTGASAGSIKYVGRDGTTYTESTTAPTNAGKYTAKVTIGGKTASADFEITKAAIKPSVTLDSWIYGGTAATPKVDRNTGNADVTYAYKIKDAEDSTYTDVTVDELQKLAVGQYTLKATVAESTNYKGGSATCDFSITRAPIKNVSVTMTGWTYGSYDKNVNAPELGADSNPGNGDVTYTYYTDKDCITKTTAKDGAESDGAVPMNAGTYYVKASVAETDHYAAGEATTSFVVKTKAITATVSAESKVYDGTTDAKVTATVETGVKGESLTLTGLKGTFADKNAGSGKIVTIDSSHANATAGENTVASNYTISYPDTTETDITPCPVELTWSDTDLIYNGTEQSVTATVKNAVKGDSFTLTYNGNTQTEVKGNYIAEVTGLGNDNYTLEKATGISQNWSISYLEAPDAEISGEEGNNGWHVSAVTLKPEDGYQISTDKKTWSDSLGYDAQGEQEATYYLKEIKTGYITDAKTASFKIDTIAPTGEITIGTNTFKEFLNKITFGHWFKDTVSVKISGEDSTSGIDTIEYQKVEKNDKYDVNGNWVEGESLSITDKDKYVIYARLTDKAGKQTIINSDGIVVFTDSTAVEAISYTKTTKKSVDAEVELNGNTVASVKNGEAVLAEGTDYTVSADKITFSGDYLDTLSAGTHTLTVSYNPQGETEYIDGEKSAESQITVNVSRQTATMEITEALDKEYNGLPAGVRYVTNSNAAVKIEYKVDGKWQSEAPTHAGSYEVKVSAPENGDYTAASVSKTLTIPKTDARISTMTSGISTYGDAVNISAGVSLVNGETYTGEVEYSYRLAGTDDEYTVGIPSKAGSYETKATVKAFGDYNGASTEGTWTIKPKEVSVSGITAKDKVYDGKAVAELDYSQAKFDGILVDDALTVSATGTFADSNVANEKSVMITDLILGGKDAGNYVLASTGRQTITTAAINPKEVSADITPNGGTYEETITPAKAVLNGLVKGDNPEITLTYTGKAYDGTEVNGIEAPTHAGTYKVTATISDSNYSLKAEGATAEYVVAKANPELNVSAVADKNYGDKAFNLETGNKGDGQKTFASDNEKVATVDENGVVTIVGAGKATLTVNLAESANYTADQKTVTIIVKKIDHKLTVEKIAYEVTYGDPAFKIVSGAEDSETAVKYASDNEDVAKVSADGTVTIGNAGTAKITVSMDESNNYLAVAKEVVVKVVPKDVTVTPIDKSKTYGEKDGELTYKADGLVGKDTLADITLSRADGEDVGIYDITSSEKKDANPNYNVKFEKGTFAITQKEIGLAWSDTELTYNGKEQKPTAKATGLVRKDACEVTVSGAQKNVGKYTATATKLSNKNYKLPKNVDTTYTIGAKEIGIKWSDAAFTYDGTAKLPVATATGLAAGDSCEIKVSGAAIEAGTYSAIAEALNNANYKLPKDAKKKFVIYKADAAVSKAPENMSGLIYNGEAQQLITEGTTSEGTIQYKVNDGEWTSELPVGIDAGDYTVSYKVVGDKNHKDSEVEKLTVKIAKKMVKVSGISAEDKTYDGTESAKLNCAGVKFDGMLDRDSLDVTAKGAFEDKSAGTDKKVAIFDLALGGKSIGNYVLSEEGQQSETTATIKPKEATVVITPNGGTYEGTITGAAADLSGAVAGEKPEVVLTYIGTANDGTAVNGTEVPTHAGTYTVTATVPDTNYSLKSEGATEEFTVAKANPELSVSAVADKDYGDKAFNLETGNKGDGQKTFASDNEKVATVDENGVVTIAGAGKATLTVNLAESANYTADQKTVTIIVKKIDHKLTVEKIAYEVTYGDPAFKIAAGAEDSETAVNYASDNEDVAKVNEDGTVTIGKVGTAKITVSMDESGNYLAVAKEVTITVVPKKVTVTPDKISKIYGEKDGELTYKADGLAREDTLADITLSRTEGENAGNYTITATQKDGANPNYDVIFKKGTFVIEPKNIETAEVTLGDALKYTGKEQTQKVTKVTINGMEVPADSYEITGNTATEAGVHTLTITAKEESNFTGTITWTYVIAPTKTEQIKENADGKVEIGNGTLTIAVKSEGKAPKASLVTGKAEIIDMLVKNGDITANELAQIADGASVDVVLTVKDASATVSKEAKTAMTDTASKAGYTIGQYIDISLYKYMTVNGVTDDGVQLHSTASKIKIAVQIPENLINKDNSIERTYYIIRYHDGKAEIVEGTYDEKTQTFTFETDKFSDYAIAYKDVKKAGAAVTGSGTGTSNTNTVKKNKTVKTGDTADVFGYLIVLFGAFAVIMGTIVSRRKRTNK